MDSPPPPERPALSGQTPPVAQALAAKRRRVLIVLGLAFIGAGLLWAGYWLMFSRNLESTNDAYVAGNQVRINARVSGMVEEILADNTQMVKAGQVLVRLDSTDAALALEKARAQLAATAREIDGQLAQLRRLKAQVVMRERELVLNQNDYYRRLRLTRGRSVTEEEVSRYKEQTAIAEAALEAARHELEAARRLLLDTPLEEQPRLRLEAENLRQAWLARQRCEIKSPVKGRVARRTVQVGSQVSPETPLMVVTPLEEIWVEANFKEGQLKKIRVGQPAVVKADLYGSGTVYRGRVAGLSAGTGSVFSLLPPENATGNWIKVVQRVPVRIALDPEDVAAAPLLLGLSCHVEVNIAAPEGPPPGLALYQTKVLNPALESVNAEIKAIVAANSSRHPAPGKAGGIDDPPR